MSEQTGPVTRSIDEALATFRETMLKDNYHLSWALSEQDTVTVQIQAGPDACADCLSPTPVMEAIMGQALAETPYTLETVILPEER